MAVVELDGVSVSYGGLTAVEDLSLSVGDGELVCLLGPSGCGKSTTLRAVAGFERPDAGRVHLDGEDVTDRPPNERDCSMVFQEWALFPNKTVLGNVAFGPRMNGDDAPHERAREVLETVEMAEYADSRPAELSGGQRQRVALARSLAADPDVLLLDEPLSNLDRRLREEVQLEIKRLQERLGTPMLYVTHDQDEAFTLADRIGVMSEGRLVQVGDPREVHDRPRTRFVEEFLGSTNLVEGRVEDGGVAALGTRLPLPTTDAAGDADTPGDAVTEADLGEGDRVTVSLRPEVLSLSVPAADGGAAAADGPDGIETTTGDGDREPVTGRVAVTGSVTDTVYRGSRLRYHVDVDGTELFVEAAVVDAPDLGPGDTVRLGWQAGDAVLFAADGRRVV